MGKLARRPTGSRPPLGKPNAGRPQLGKPNRGSDTSKNPPKPNRRPGFGEVQDGLTYAGGGFYHTPLEEVDPRDCTKWPNSIWCSGLFSPDIRDLPGVANSFGPPIGAGIEFVADECNIGIEIQPYLGFVAQPTQQLVWRKPECRGARPSLNFDLPPFEPQEPWKGKELLDPYPDDALLHVIHHEDGSPPKSGFFCEVRDPGDNLWGAQLLLWYEYTPFDDGPQAGVTYREAFWFHSDKWQGRPVWHYKPGVVGFEQWEYRLDWDRAPFTIYGTGGRLWTASKRDWIAFLNWRNMVRPCAIIIVYPFGACLNKPTPTPPPPTPPNYLPIPPMKCCRNKNEEAVRAVLKELKEIKKAIGKFPVEGVHYHKKDPDKTGYKQEKQKIPSLSEGIKEIYNIADKMQAVTDAERMIKEGYKLPKRLIYPLGIKDRSTVKYDTIPGLFEFVIKQLDRSVGILPQKIKISDGDPAQKGNQKVEIESHSLASMMKEILEVAIENRGDIDVTNLMLVRTLIETGLVHQLSVKAHSMLDALVDWADFKVEYKNARVNFVFNPLAGTKKGKGFGQKENQKANVPDNEKELEKILPELLKETTVKVPIITNVDKGKTQADYYREILKYSQLAGEAVTETATASTLERLVEASYQAMKLQSMIDRSNIREALTGGLFSKGDGNAS